MDNTYWSHNGRFQKEYEELWERLVPGQGPAATKAGEALRALSKLYYRWFNDGDRIENSMTEWDAEGGAARAFNYLYQFRDAASGFTARELMENVVSADTEEAYEAALEKAADAIIEWAAGQPDTPNTEDFLDKRFLGTYEFDIIPEDEEEDW